jgi:hypothetical protein
MMPVVTSGAIAVAGGPRCRRGSRRFVAASLRGPASHICGGALRLSLAGILEAPRTHVSWRLRRLPASGPACLPASRCQTPAGPPASRLVLNVSFRIQCGTHAWLRLLVRHSSACRGGPRLSASDSRLRASEAVGVHAACTSAVGANFACLLQCCSSTVWLETRVIRPVTTSPLFVLRALRRPFAPLLGKPSRGRARRSN